MFPIIKTLADLTPFVEGNSQFRIDRQANGFTVVCYMLKDEDTFGGANAEFKAECRGITFNPDGSIASRALHKFSNVGEGADSQPDMIPWDQICRVMDKRDGSMVHPVAINGEVVFKTKKSFTSAEAIAATEFLKADSEKYNWVVDMMAQGCTPIFEWTSPRFPIVLVYEKDELTLLQIRNNITGEYVTLPQHWEVFAEGCQFKVVENLIEQFSWVMEDEGIPKTIEVRWDLLKAAAETRSGIEGWIVQAVDGQMWKIKTKWYCDLHHSVTFTRYRDVARSVLLDQSDDLKAAFALTGRSIQPIVDIEKEVFGAIEAAELLVKEIVEFTSKENMSVKDVAVKFCGHSLFRQIMRTIRNQDIDWLDWYTKVHLDQAHSLEVIPV